MTEIRSLEDWELLAQFCQAYRSFSDALVDEIGMHRAQSALLCKLFHEDGVTQSSLAQQLSVQGATVTEMLQRMEDTGLVTRRRDPDDNRLVRVYLTEAGHEKERAIREQFAKLERAVFANFDSDEQGAARHFLSRMLENLSAER